MTAAKRGDTVAIVTTSHDYVIGKKGATVRESVALATVTSVTRDGIVKAAQDWGHEGSPVDLTRPDSRRRVLVVPADVDTVAARALYVTRRYPSAPHSAMVPPFGSVEECRAFLGPFRSDVVMPS